MQIQYGLNIISNSNMKETNFLSMHNVYHRDDDSQSTTTYEKIKKIMQHRGNS